MKKNRIRSIMWLLLLGIGTATILQSCRKEPVDPCCETPCNLYGYIAYEPAGCMTPPGGEIGIMGDDGVFYRIKKDYTGQFSKLPVGTYVSFGMCQLKDVDDVKIQPMLIWSPPQKEGNLGCIEEKGRPDDPGNCDQVAEVVGVSYLVNGAPTEGPYLRINEHVYAVRGDLADEFQQYPIGSYVKVSATISQDCYLPAVMTYPAIEGCVELTCISPLYFTTH